MVVGDALGLPMRMVLMPGHALARWDDGKTRINIETTDKGKERTNDQYFEMLGRPPPEDIKSLGWGRSLSKREFFGDFSIATGSAARPLPPWRQVNQVEWLAARPPDMERPLPLYVAGESGWMATSHVGSP